MIGYYSHYIQDFAICVVLLTNALKENIKKERIQWNEECKKAFQELKGKLTSSYILYASYYRKHFIVQTDDSLYFDGILLSQIRDREEHPIFYLRSFLGQSRITVLLNGN